jgi:hypothetical protein
MNYRYCRGEYLDQSGRKWWEAGENCIMKSVIKFYASSKIIRVIKSWRMRSVEQMSRLGVMKNAYTISWLENVKGKTIGRPRNRWKDNIIMDLWKKGWENVNWLDLSQDSDQWRAVEHSVPIKGR